MISSLPGSALRMHVESLGKPCDSTSVLKALPGPTVSLSLSHWYPGSGVVLDSQVRIQREGQGVRTPPGKSQVIWVSIGNKQLDPTWKKLDPPLENVGPPLEP